MSFIHIAHYDTYLSLLVILLLCCVYFLLSSYKCICTDLSITLYQETHCHPSIICIKYQVLPIGSVIFRKSNDGTHLNSNLKKYNLANTIAVHMEAHTML